MAVSVSWWYFLLLSGTLQFAVSPVLCVTINSTLSAKDLPTNEGFVYAISAAHDEQLNTTSSPISTFNSDEILTRDVESPPVTVKYDPIAPHTTLTQASKCQSSCFCSLTLPSVLQITCQPGYIGTNYTLFPGGPSCEKEIGSLGNDTWKEEVVEVHYNVNDHGYCKSDFGQTLCHLPYAAKIVLTYNLENYEHFPWSLFIHNCSYSLVNREFIVVSRGERWVWTPNDRRVRTSDTSEIRANSNFSSSWPYVMGEVKMIATDGSENLSREFPIASICDHLLLQSLDLSGYSMENMDASAYFNNCQQLEILNFSRTGVSGRQLESVRSELLTRLDLSDNSIEQIPFFMLHNGTTEKLLTQLNYSGKAFASNLTWWNSLRHLQQLELSNNSISKIERGVFTCHMKELERLDLSANQLTSLKACTFSDLISLRTLNISHNELGPDLLEVMWGSNCSTSADTACPDDITNTEDPLQTIGYDYGDQSIIWSKLNAIDLSHNRIVSVDNSVLRAPAIKNVRKLLLNNNNIKSLPHSALEHLPKLEHLELQHNNLSWLDVGTFNNPKLLYLDLSHNQLHKIISMAFLYMPHIVFVDLSYNRLHYMYKYAFYRICKYDQRVTIAMNHNDLGDDIIWKLLSTFRHLENTKCEVTVDLVHNNISHFVSDLGLLRGGFERKGDLRYFSSWNHVAFDLGHNPINCNCELYDEVKLLSHIKFTVFPNVTSLKMEFWKNLNCTIADEFGDYSVPAVLDRMTCWVENGHIHALHCPQLCTCMPSDPYMQFMYDLEGLDIIVNCSGNQLQHLPAALPESSIVVLDLSHNSISTFSPHQHQLVNVTFIDLSYNAICTIQEGALQHFARLRTLHLHHNHLQEIPRDLSKLYSLAEVTLYHNQLKCVCDDIWMLAWLVNKSLIRPGNESSLVRCATGVIVSKANIRQFCLSTPSPPARFNFVISPKSTHIYVLLALGAVLIIALAGLPALLVICRRKGRMKLEWIEQDEERSDTHEGKATPEVLLVYADKAWNNELDRFTQGWKEVCPALLTMLYPLPGKGNHTALCNFQSYSEFNYFTVVAISEDLLRDLPHYKTILRELLGPENTLPLSVIFVNFTHFDDLCATFRQHLLTDISECNLLQHDDPEIYQKLLTRMEEMTSSCEDDLDNDIELNDREDRALVPLYSSQCTAEVTTAAITLERY